MPAPDPRQKLREKIAQQRPLVEAEASLRTARDNARVVVAKAKEAVETASQRLEAAKETHTAGLASAFSTGAAAVLQSPATREARTALQDTEDQHDAAVNALRNIDAQLAEVAAKVRQGSENFMMTGPLSEAVRPDVERLIATLRQRQLELVRLREALRVLDRNGLAMGFAVQRLLEGFLFVGPDTDGGAGLLPELREARNVSDWAVAIERLKTDADAQLPVF